MSLLQHVGSLVAEARTGAARLHDAIPAPTRDGLLPAGVHTAGWDEFEARFATNDRRRELFDHMREACAHLRVAGARRVLVGGSYVTDKAAPGDVDLVYMVEHGMNEGDAWYAAHTRWKQGARAYPHDMVLTDHANLGRPDGSTIVDLFSQTRAGKAVGMVELELVPGASAQARAGVRAVRHDAAAA